MANRQIVLSENQIEALINGETISVRLNNGDVADIRQSYVKDALLPIKMRDNKVVNTKNNAVINKRLSDAMMADYFKE